MLQQIAHASEWVLGSLELVKWDSGPNGATYAGLKEVLEVFFVYQVLEEIGVFQWMFLCTGISMP